MTVDLTRERALGFADAHRAELEEALRELVEIPTVSALRDRRADILRGAEAAAERLRRLGGTAEVLWGPDRASSNPIVYGRLGNDPALPTVTVYNHLDVQPADRERDGWRTDPFRMTIDGEFYRGRGTTDDKGPALTALYGALLAREAGVPVNIAFLWEMEEEIGSPHFEDILAAHGARMATHSVIVSDTVWISREQPAVPAGLRGLQGFLFRLRTGERDEHSGVTGGAARNPLAELMQVVSEAFDARTGHVKIPGFYDDVVPPTPAELRDFAESGFTIEGFKKDHHFHSVRMEDPVEMMRAVWAKPTFEVHGVIGGYSGEGLKTVVPPYAEVKVSCRLVPRLTCAATAARVTAFVKSRCPDAEVVLEHGLEPYLAPTTGPLADAVRAAIAFGFGKRPVFVREGGSIGAVVTMEKRLSAPVTFLGLSLPEHGYHAPNECYDWSQARGGIASFAEYFRQVARIASASK